MVEEYLRTLEEHIADPVNPRPRDVERTPRERLLALFERRRPPGRLRGCPFHNAAVEAAGTMPEVQDVVHRQKQDYIDGIVRLAELAGARDPQQLGDQLAVLYEGAAALATSLDDPAPWLHARRAAEVLIDAQS